MIRRLLAILGLTAVSAFAQTSAPVTPKPQTHALVTAITIVSAPVVHPKRTFKQTVGLIVGSGEVGIDVAHTLTSILDNGTVPPAGSTAPENKMIMFLHVPFHAANSVVAKADIYTEKAELYLFGVSN